MRVCLYNDIIRIIFRLAHQHRMKPNNIEYLTDFQYYDYCKCLVYKDTIAINYRINIRNEYGDIRNIRTRKINGKYIY